MHPYQQTAMAEHLIVVFIDIFTWNLVYLVYYQIPATQVKVTYAKINTLNTHISNEVL